MHGGEGARRCAVGVSIALAVALSFVSADASPAPRGLATRSTSADLAAKRYVAAGDRAYVIGTQDGSFAPLGWHTTGEMGGVWAHPIKLLDGYWFALQGDWASDATRYTTGPGFARLTFPRADGIGVTRTEFSPDGLPVVLVRVRLANAGASSRRLALTMDARSELMAAYPWASTDPTAAEANGRDGASYAPSSGVVRFKERGKPWYALIGSSERPARGSVGDRFWGPVSAPQRAEHTANGDGTGARLRWRLEVPADGARTLWIAVAGSHASRAEAAEAVRRALTRPRARLRAKIESRLALLDKSRVRLPDARLDAAFDWGKLNLADLRRTVPQVRVRDVDEGKAYPAPVATIPELTGIGAGYPDYPWFFGTDGAYTAHPLVASGQWDTAARHLRSIKRVSRAINGDTGKVIHEVTTDGSVYFGANDDAGNTNETAQFASAVHLLWLWSGRDRFMNNMYEFIVDGLRYVTTTLDEDDDGWPEGNGMVEREGMGSEKLDVTVYTWEALRALEDMARHRGDLMTAQWADGEADQMLADFELAWWMNAPSLYADSICRPGDDDFDGTNVCTRAGQRLQQRHWITATPMEVRLASRGHARRALETLEGRRHTAACGLYHTGIGGGPEGEGELTCWTLPGSTLAVGEANYGRLGRRQALFYMRSIATQLDLEMPGALPEIAPSPDYDPFAPFVERAMFMQAWSSYGIQWPVIHNFLGIAPNVPARRLAIVPDVPGSWPGLSVRALRVGGGAMRALASHDGRRYVTRVRAPAGWELALGHTLRRGARVASVTLDGAPADFHVRHTARGVEVVASTTTTGDLQSLQVIAR